MSEEDLEFLSDHQESSHPLNAPLDYSINITLNSTPPQQTVCAHDNTNGNNNGT